MTKTELIQKIDEILPQTQCTRCGYPSCLDYARAISNQEALINQCPPGGKAGIIKLAKLLNIDALALNPKNGEEKPQQIAIINEDACIGCTLCIKACPVDAIIGSNKMMHTVLSEACSSCDLCIPACPVDCISMLEDPQEWTLERKAQAKNHYNQKKDRQQEEQKAREERLKQQSQLLKNVASSGKNLIDEIIAKAKNKA